MTDRSEPAHCLALERHGSRFRAEVHEPRVGITLVRLHGDLDAAAAACLERVLTEVGGPGARRRVVVDLAGVGSAVDEAVDVIVEAELRARTTGGRLELLSPSPDVVLMLHGQA